jgi:hypothetical protein
MISAPGQSGLAIGGSLGDTGTPISPDGPGEAQGLASVNQIAATCALDEPKGRWSTGFRSTAMAPPRSQVISWLTSDRLTTHCHCCAHCAAG